MFLICLSRKNKNTTRYRIAKRIVMKLGIVRMKDIPSVKAVPV
jgi:hypothetical protein